MRLAVVAFAVVALAGCATRHGSEQAQAEADAAREEIYRAALRTCSSWGLEEGTTPHTECAYNVFVASQSQPAQAARGKTKPTQADYKAQGEAVSAADGADLLQRVMRGLFYGAMGAAAAQSMQPTPAPPPRIVSCRWIGPNWVCM